MAQPAGWSFNFWTAPRARYVREKQEINSCSKISDGTALIARKFLAGSSQCEDPDKAIKCMDEHQIQTNFGDHQNQNVKKCLEEHQTQTDFGDHQNQKVSIGTQVEYHDIQESTSRGFSRFYGVEIKRRKHADENSLVLAAAQPGVRPEKKKKTEIFKEGLSVLVWDPRAKDYTISSVVVSTNLKHARVLVKDNSGRFRVRNRNYLKIPVKKRRKKKRKAPVKPKEPMEGPMKPIKEAKAPEEGSKGIAFRAKSKFAGLVIRRSALVNPAGLKISGRDIKPATRINPEGLKSSSPRLGKNPAGLKNSSDNISTAPWITNSVNEPLRPPPLTFYADDDY